jgi:hypothetical protein
MEGTQMAEITLNTRLVLRNDTSANWGTNGTKVLLKGEPIIIWDGTTPKIKIGDGTQTVANLPWAFINSSDAQSLITAEIDKLNWVKNVTITGTGNGLATATYTGGILTITKGNFLTAHQDISGKVDKINTTAKESGFYKFAYNTQGQVTSSTPVTKSDITSLGIPAQDTNTTYIFSGASVSGGANLTLTPSTGNANNIGILGSGATTVSFAEGKITISSTDTNTTYTFEEGSTNGAFTVTPSGSSSQSVKIHGLKSAAYTESSAYATAAQGTLATNAMPKAGGTFTGAPIWATAPTADGHLANKKYVDDIIALKVASVFKFKGTKPTFEDLPKTGNVEGDVWHIEADHTEYVWATVDGALNPSWEALGGTIDLTGYALKTDLKSLTFKSGDATAVYSPLTEKEFTFTAGNNITLALASTGLTISATDTKLTNVANSTGKVFTGVSNGTTITTTNVGALVLTGFAASTSDTGALAATDTITKALNKLYNLANSKTSNTGTVTSVATGGGLTGGPITTSGTISHANKPSSGTALEAGTGSGLTFLTEIALDAYGHVATAKKATVTLPTAASLGALTSITAGAGITVNTKSGTTQTVSISTTDTFILDGGTAA